MKKAASISCAMLAALALGACSTALVEKDRYPDLQPGQGLVGMQISTLGSGQSTFVAAWGGGSDLVIASTDTQAVYLVVAQAGHYCLHQYASGGASITAQHDDACFDVAPGGFTYAGSFTLLATIGAGGRAVATMQQRDDWEQFKHQLLAAYPNIAKRVLSAEDLQAMQRQAIEDSSTGICAALGADTAAALLGVSVGLGTQSDVFGHSCTFSHSDTQAVHLGVLSGPDVGPKRFDGLTDVNPYSGWKDWTPIPGLGLEAKLGNRHDVYELVILLEDKIVVLTVEGSSRADIAAAMVATARDILSKDPE